MTEEVSKDVREQSQLRRSVHAIADRAAKAAAKEAVVETLTALGIDVSDKIKAQEQFAALRRLSDSRTLDNLDWLDSLHKSAERVTETSWRTLIKIAVTGIVGLVVLMTREYWANHIPWK